MENVKKSIDKPILVHCHVFYKNLWDELKECINNINPYNFDLYITLVYEDDELIKDINDNFPNAKIEIVENKGYDIGPFFYILNKVNLDNYSYIVKIHTKRDMPPFAITSLGYDISGNKFRKMCLNFLSTKNVFENIINSFNTDQDLGMVSDYRLIVKSKYDDKIIKPRIIEYMKNMGCKKTSYTFVGGTMFICRAYLLKPLQELNIKLSDFEIVDVNYKHHLAHVMERILGFVITQQDKTIKDVFNNKDIFDLEFFRRLIFLIKRKIYQKKVTNNGYFIIKIFSIPVIHKKL